ncbi:hypothetical protein J7E87_22990 [Streptomyces sp. ISL-1]|uniref:hypothetical protein n=1 Tax=Streptomyces sp. ISL-1 TaxID=2817657 RepID=UPI001BEC3607|nr:hypothetical protein [Streptomyces sp. ISL-1]MBT2392207.1 hypothetical protein [Streptomyces sp. ISL-1]
MLGYVWDAKWYLGIAQHGYGQADLIPGYGGGPAGRWQDLAFFPLYPGVVRAVSELLPMTIVGTALLITCVSSCVAAWGIHALGTVLHGRRVGLLLVILWGLLPQAFIQSMAYPEAMFTALCAWSLYALVTQRLITASLLAVAAGLTRPLGVAVVAAVVITAVLASSRGRRTLSAIVIAPLGLLGYFVWAGVCTGRPLGYFDVQRDWNTRVDFGQSVIASTSRVAAGNVSAVEQASVLIVITGLVLLWALLSSRPPTAVIVFSLVLVAVAVGVSGYIQIKPRFLLPGFTLLLPAATSLAKAKPITLAMTFAVLAFISFKYGAYFVIPEYTP